MLVNPTLLLPMAGTKQINKKKERKMYSLCSFRQSNIIGVSKQQYFQVLLSIHVLCGKSTSTSMALVPVDSATLLNTETHESHGHFLVIDLEGEKKERKNGLLLLSGLSGKARSVGEMKEREQMWHLLRSIAHCERHQKELRSAKVP